MPGRWALSPEYELRGCGPDYLAFHAGSGDTHVLGESAAALIDVLAAAGEPVAAEQLLQDEAPAGIGDEHGGADTSGVGETVAQLAHLGVIVEIDP